MQLMIMAFIAGAVMGIFKLGYKYLFGRTTRGKLTQIHFSPAILIAYLLCIWRYING